MNGLLLNLELLWYSTLRTFTMFTVLGVCQDQTLSIIALPWSVK